MTSLSLSELLQPVMLSTRMLPMFLFGTLFKMPGIPNQVRVLLTVCFGILLTQVYVDLPSNIGVLGVLTEIMIGLVFVVVVNTSFSAFQIAGRMLDFAMSLSTANLIDPSSKEMSALFGVLLSLTASLMFFAINGHHALIQAMVTSYQFLPVASGVEQIDPMLPAKHFSKAFAYGFLIAAPVVVVLLLIDVLMAFAAKSMPQLNVFILLIPVKVMVGLFVLASSLSFVSGLFNQIFVESIQILGR